MVSPPWALPLGGAGTLSRPAWAPPSPDPQALVLWENQSLLTISIENGYFPFHWRRDEHSCPRASLALPGLKAKVLVKLQNEVVIHNAILKVDPPTGRVTAKSARCKGWVRVPLRYGMSGDMTAS